jgi:hypothetical protein
MDNPELSVTFRMEDSDLYSYIDQVFSQPPTNDPVYRVTVVYYKPKFLRHPLRWRRWRRMFGKHVVSQTMTFHSMRTTAAAHLNNY